MKLWLLVWVRNIYLDKWMTKINYWSHKTLHLFSHINGHIPIQNQILSAIMKRHLVIGLNFEGDFYHWRLLKWQKWGISWGSTWVLEDKNYVNQGVDQNAKIKRCRDHFDLKKHIPHSKYYRRGAMQSYGLFFSQNFEVFKIIFHFGKTLVMWRLISNEILSNQISISTKSIHNVSIIWKTMVQAFPF